MLFFIEIWCLAFVLTAEQDFFLRETCFPCFEQNLVFQLVLLKSAKTNK